MASALQYADVMQAMDLSNAVRTVLLVGCGTGYLATLLGVIVSKECVIVCIDPSKVGFGEDFVIVCCVYVCVFALCMCVHVCMCVIVSVLRCVIVCL